MSSPSFRYKRLTQFYETDAMGIIHHANYVLYMEEARLQFLQKLMGSSDGEPILSEINYPLVSCHVDYKKPIRFNEQVTIDYQVSIKGVRLVFEYTLSTKSFDKPVAFGKTVHVAFDMKKQSAIKLPKQVEEFLQAQRM